MSLAPLSPLLAPAKAFLRLKLHWRILLALVVGAAVGGAVNAWGSADSAIPIFDFIGQLFLRALKMIIVPLIASSIITGVLSVGNAKKLGRLGGKTFLYYMSTSLLAILTGLLLANLIQPGVIDGEAAASRLPLDAEKAAEFATRTSGRGLNSLVEIFVRMVPENPIRAAAEGQILALIFFCLLFGFVVSGMADERGRVLKSFFEGVFEAMMKLTQIIISFAPFGVFGLIAKTTAMTGFDAFLPLAKYFMTVVLALGVHFFLTLPLLLLLVSRIRPSRHYRAMAPALLTAFSTSSSSATLPLTMQCMEKRAGVSNETSSFVLPLGATVNMDGTALYECVAVIFIAQAYGFEMSLTTQIIVVITALLASIGAAGVPNAGLVMIAIILNALGWPLEGMGLILVVDRPLDMMRTTVNVFSDSCGAAIIGQSEGEALGYDCADSA